MMNTRLQASRRKAQSLFSDTPPNSSSLIPSQVPPSLYTQAVNSLVEPSFPSDTFTMLTDHSETDPQTESVSTLPEEVVSKPEAHQAAAHESLRSEDLVALTEKAKELSIDPNTLLIYQCLSRQETKVVYVPRDPPNAPEKIIKLIGNMSESEYIVSFLNRFKMELGNKGIPLDNFQSYLPYCLPGSTRNLTTIIFHYALNMLTLELSFLMQADIP